MELETIKDFSDNFDNSLSFNQVFEKYLVNWRWFVVSVFLFITLAYLKIRSEVPKYDASALVLIKPNQKGNSITDISSFENLGIFGKDRSTLENEIHILSSRRLLEQVVKELKLNIQYYIDDKPFKLEVYHNTPVILEFLNSTDSLQNDESYIVSIDDLNASFSIKIVSKNMFEYFNSEDESLGMRNFDEAFESDFGEIIKLKINSLRTESFIGEKIVVRISPIDLIVDSYSSGLDVHPIDDESSVLRISLAGVLPQKSILIINNLIEQYNADAVDDKAQIYNKTADFLTERIDLLMSQLTAIETSAEQFKTEKGLVDVQSESGVFLQSSSTNERDLINANTQLQMINYMINELKKNNSTDLLPMNIGLSDPSILSLIGEFNDLVLQRNRILKSSTTRNPLIVSLDSQLNVLKENLKISLNTLSSSMQIRINSLRTQSGALSSKIAAVPKNERLFKDITRKQETKNALYLFLLQKREESEISKSVSVDNAKIIDPAYSNGKPISPKKLMIYLAALIMGLFFPFAFIYVKELIDTKVHGENDVKQLKIPYLGDIPLTNSENDLYIDDIDNSNIAESFRYLRTNINFMLDRKEMGKTVFVTSTVSGEGKTFSAINLAYSLAISGKKTVLLGMDLRAPKINNYLGIEKKKGVTNFIKDEGLNIEDITANHINFENLYLIDSGDIPPNPVELLMSKRVDELFNNLKEKYEFIIVDTAPVGMVTDTIQIGQYADLTIYVIKANSLDKRMLHIPDKINKEKKLPNMAILINGSDQTKGAYGYGYGYGKSTKQLWYKKFFKKEFKNIAM